MISALGIAALQHAGDESAHGASSRRKLKAVFAADAALSVVEDRLMNDSPLSASYTAPMDEPTFLTNDWGMPIAVRSGTFDSTVPAALMRVGSARAKNAQLNVGSQAATQFAIYRTAVVASDPGGGRAQVQAQFKVPEGGTNY